MDNSTPVSAYVLKALTAKLAPSRFPGMSPRTAALVGFVLGASFIEPPIVDVRVSTAGMLLARVRGEAATKHVIGTYTDIAPYYVGCLNSASIGDPYHRLAIPLAGSVDCAFWHDE